MDLNSVDDTLEYDSVFADTIMDDSRCMTTEKKLQVILDALREVKWSFHQFLLAWAGVRLGSNDVQLEHPYYRTVQQRRDQLNRATVSLQDAGVIPSSAVEQLEHELDQLIPRPYFGRFDSTTNLETIDFDEAFRIIKVNAPYWHSILMPLISNQRSHRQSYNANSESSEAFLSKRLYAITSMVLHSRAKIRSNFLAAMLGSYLVGSGTKRRVIETFAGLGITHGYHQANRNMNDTADNAAKYVSIPSPNSCELRGQSTCRKHRVRRLVRRAAEPIQTPTSSSTGQLVVAEPSH